MQQASGAAHLQCFQQEKEQADLVQPPLSYPVPELPGLTGVSRSVIYTEIRKGHLASFKLGAKRYVRHSSVLDWLERLEAET